MSDTLYKLNLTKEINPSVHGFYKTDRGELFWRKSESVWTINNQKFSEEYPNWWIEKFLPVEQKPISDEHIEKHWIRNNCFGTYLEGLIYGSKWMRDELINNLYKNTQK